jgi:hypothetical protein
VGGYKFFVIPEGYLLGSNSRTPTGPSSPR